MSIIKTALVAVSFVAIAATANAQGREDLNSGIHGESAASLQSRNVAPYAAVTRDARGAFAQAQAVRGRALVQPQWQQQDANPLFDDFHH